MGLMTRQHQEVQKSIKSSTLLIPDKPVLKVETKLCKVVLVGFGWRMKQFFYPIESRLS